MANTIYSQGDKIEYGIKIFVVDTEEDKTNLSIRSAKMGSKCYVIATKKWYILDGSNEWVPFVDAGGSGGSPFIPKGSAATIDELPTEGNEVGDLYIVQEDGSEWVWWTSEDKPDGYWEKLGAEGGGGNAKNAFIATFTKDNYNTWSTDKDISEIREAYDTNKLILFKYDDGITEPIFIDDGQDEYFTAKMVYYDANGMNYYSFNVVGGYGVSVTVTPFINATSANVASAIGNFNASQRSTAKTGLSIVEATAANVSSAINSFSSSQKTAAKTALGVVEATSANVASAITNFSSSQKTTAKSDLGITEATSTNVASAISSFNASQKTTAKSDLGIVEATAANVASAIDGMDSTQITNVKTNLSISDPFIVSFTDNNGWSATKTYAEITAAITANKVVVFFLTNTAGYGCTSNIFVDTTNNILRASIPVIIDTNIIIYHISYTNANVITVTTSQVPIETYITISDTAATITPADNTIYKCGELTSLTISNPPATGSYEIIFTSGATATSFSIPQTIYMPDSFSIEANMRYEISISDNYGVGMGWSTI